MNIIMKIFISILVYFATYLVLASLIASAPAKMVYQNDLENYSSIRSKKPFCNAFTGCGRKRSVENIPFQDENDLSDTSISETKLWEALQQAKQELLRKQYEDEASQIWNAGLYSDFDGNRAKRCAGKKRC